MKRLIFFAMTGISLPMPAAPANPRPFEMTGPDGEVIMVTLHGDEDYHWLTDDAGRVYDMTAAGTLEPLAARPARVRRRVSRRLMGTDGVPTTGSVHGLVILAEFADMPFSGRNSREVFYDALNAEGYSADGATGSVRDYFIHQSGGKFTPEFDVVGPVRLSNDMAYYGSDVNGAKDPNAYRMINEACLLAHDAGTDFSRYDSDGDGTVDLVYVIYSGYSQSNGASTNTIWPHMWFLSECNTLLTLDGVTVDRYACSAERAGISGDTMAGIGLFCHEFSHTLGLPDIYDVTYSSSSIKMGPWDVMDSGCYNNSMRTPAGYSAYEKMALGWIEPEELTVEAGRVSLPPLGEGKAYRLTSPVNPDEYYLLETRTRDDVWDAWLPGEGMLVTHVDYDSEAWEANHVNTGDNWRLHLVPANGDFTSACDGASTPFPGTGDVRFLTDLTTPSTVLNDGTALGVPLTDIERDDAGVSFTVGATLEAPLTAEPTRVTSDGFRANWEPVVGARTYTVRLVADTDGSERVFEKVVKNYYTFTGLAEGETYRWQVRAVGDYLMSGWSDEGVVSLAPAAVDRVEADDRRTHYFTPAGMDAGNEYSNLRPGIYIRDGKKIIILK